MPICRQILNFSQPPQIKQPHVPPTTNPAQQLAYHKQYKRIIVYSIIIITLTTSQMQSETLFSLVGKIRVQRIRLAQQAAPTLTCPWTAEESIKFYELIELYGADFGLIQAYFPERSRKQIRRKYQEMEQRYGKRMHRIEMRRDEERRKNFFDQEILESNMIIWPKKPNIAESSSSEDSL